MKFRALSLINYQQAQQSTNLLVIRAYNCCTLLQERNLLRSYNVDPPTFIKYMFVIEANYHKTNPYHNATHGADVMQSCHVLLGYSVVEVSRKGNCCYGYVT